MGYELTREITGRFDAAIVANVCVTSAESGTFVVAGANAPGIVGILQEEVTPEDITADGPIVERTVYHITSARVKAVAGAAIDVSSATVPVTSNASGQVVTATTGQNAIGFAEQSAAAAGEVIDILLAPHTVA